MKRRHFLQISAGSALASFAFHQLTHASSPPPNILLILADDLGYADLGCQGCTDIPTPHIDSLARHGIRFTDAYVSGPVCSPTRAGLLTGRYQQRFGHEFNPNAATIPGDHDKDIGLPVDEITIADLLKQAGYRTGLVGKWHLGALPHYLPNNRGFQDFYGFLSGSRSYLPGQDIETQPILRQNQQINESEYLTDAFARESISFIQSCGSNPFFLYLSFNAVHRPLEAVPTYLDRFPHIQDEKRRTYAAMLSAMDDAVGRVLDCLKEQGLYDNTLIFFLSDNGGPCPMNASLNTPLRATKATVYEGGIRVPFLIQWPQQLPQNQLDNRLASSLDIFPTILAAAQIPLPASRPIDGVNLLAGHQEGARDQLHEYLCWRYWERYAIRKDNWKLVQIPDRSVELYNLTDDIGESTDLAEKMPDKVAELKHHLSQWEAEMIPARWRDYYPFSDYAYEAENSPPPPQSNP